jgi:uncharacterized protein YaeQ
VALLSCGRSLWSWEQLQLPKLSGGANLVVVTLEQEFMARLMERLERAITWAVTISDNTLYLDVGTDSFETPVRLLAGER